MQRHERKRNQHLISYYRPYFFLRKIRLGILLHGPGRRRASNVKNVYPQRVIPYPDNLLTGGVFMEIFFVIIALIAVCAAVFLRGKAWTDFTNDLSKKDTPDKK